MKCSKCPSYSDEPHRFWCPDRFKHTPEESGAKTAFDCGVRRVPESMKINVQPDLFRAGKLIAGSGYAPAAVNWGDNSSESKAVTVNVQPYAHRDEKLTPAESPSVESLKRFAKVSNMNDIPSGADYAERKRKRQLETDANHRRLMEVMRSWNIDGFWNMR